MVRRVTNSATISANESVAGQIKFDASAAYSGVTVDNTLIRFDGTAGHIQPTGIVVDDSDNISLFAAITQKRPGGFWVDRSPSVNIARIDRLFVGEACNATGQSYDNNHQGSIADTATQGANWALRDSDLLSISAVGQIALTGFSKSSMQPDPLVTECIGVAGFVINDKASGAAWALYADVQHESGASQSLGVEFAIKNKGANDDPDPYSGGATVGCWFAGGGDGSYGGAPTNPSGAAMVVLANSHTWNKGLVFKTNSLTGSFPAALALPPQYKLAWYRAAGSEAASIRSDSTLSGHGTAMVFQDSTIGFFGADSTNMFQMRRVASAVNFIDVISSVTGAGPTLSAQGSDGNIDLLFDAKGTGSIKGGSLTRAAALPINLRTVATINFNSANSDNSFPIVLPPGYTRYRVGSVIISGASASITTATFGLFTAAAGGGTAVIANNAIPITVASASENTNNNMHTASPATANTQSYNAATLFFRIGTAQGSAATATVTINIQPVS